MGLAALLNLEGSDIAALFVAGVLGFLASLLAPPGFWSILTYLLVSYHLSLGWLVFSGERKAAVSLPIVSTIFTHLASLAVVLPLGLARYYVPLLILQHHPSVQTLVWLAIVYFFTPVLSILRYAVIGFAVFERFWLFSGSEVQLPAKPVEVPDSPILQAATGDDFKEWQHYLAQQKPGSRKLGASIKAEYEQWLHARQKSRQAAASDDGPSLGR